VEADVVTVAKGIASGLPLSAIVLQKRSGTRSLPAPWRHVSAANAVACAAGVATFKAIEEEGMLATPRAKARSCARSGPASRRTYPMHRRGARQGPS